VDEGLRGYQTDAGGRKVVLWQGERVGVLDFEKPERKKEFFERGPEIEWLFEKGKNIRQAYFVCDAAYVLFCDGNKNILVRMGSRTFPWRSSLGAREKRVLFMPKKPESYIIWNPPRANLWLRISFRRGSLFPA